jgi:hypothetical protein
MKAKIFTFILFLAVFGVANAQFEVFKTAALPTVDGVADDQDPWQENLWTDQALNSAGTSTTDASSMFQLLHDGETIALGVKVTDATPNNGGDIGNTYERDCVETFFHMSLVDADDGTYGVYQDWTWQYRIQRDGDDGAFVDGKTSDDFEWAVTTDDAGYTVEVTYPIATLVSGYADWDGENFKFDIQTADNTTGAGGGRTQQMFWNNNTDDQWRDTKVFGPAMLSETMVGVGVQNIENAVGSVWVSNDVLNFDNVEGNVSIYSISGALVKKANIDRNGTMDISSLKSGIYIVKSDKLTAKILK